MVIFNSYVKLPEGTHKVKGTSTAPQVGPPKCRDWQPKHHVGMLDRLHDFHLPQGCEANPCARIESNGLRICASKDG